MGEEGRKEELSPEITRGETIDVMPLSKGRRILSYLADALLCFILSFALMHLAVYPLGKLAYGYRAKQEESSLIEEKMHEVLYGNKLLFPSSDQSAGAGQFEEDLRATFDSYAYYYAVDSGKAEYEVFRHYAVDIQGDESLYASFYQGCAKASAFFDFAGGTPMLKRFYALEFAPKWAPKDSLSEQGEKDYQSFLEEVFLPLYSSMLEDAKTRGLSYQDERGETLDYKELKRQMDAYSAGFKRLFADCAFLAQALGLLLYGLFLPLLLPSRKSLGELFLRQTRIGLTDLAPLPRKRMWAPFLSTAFSSSWGLFLLPWPEMGFNELFGLGAPFLISLLSLLYALVSLGFILFDPFGRSLGDHSSMSALVQDDDLDAVYAKKGYLA